MKTYNGTGIVLRRGDYRENDRLFVLYSKEYGKLELVARGTKKILSKLNPHLEPMNEVKFMVAKGKGFDKLGNATAISVAHGIKQSDNLDKISAGAYMLEATEHMVPHRQSDAQVYETLQGGLEFLSRMPEGEAQYAYAAHVYILKLLDCLGYRPNLIRCVECSRGMLFPKQTYDFLRGGVVCASCAHEAVVADHYDISDSVIHMLLTALSETYTTIDNFRFSPADTRDFNHVVGKVLAYQCPRPLQSFAFGDFFKALSVDMGGG